MKKQPARNSAICASFKNGANIVDLAAQYGVTRQRIQQILKINNLCRWDGGQHFASVRHHEAMERHRERKFQERFGLTRTEWKSLRAIAEDYRKCPLYFYHQQKRNAYTRKIEWKLSIKEWWSIWEQSGKWQERGRAKESYVMARFLDQGAYEVGNVRIISVVENVKEYYALYGEEHKQLVRAGRGIA